VNYRGLDVASCFPQEKGGGGREELVEICFEVYNFFENVNQALEGFFVDTSSYYALLL